VREQGNFSYHPRGERTKDLQERSLIVIKEGFNAKKQGENLDHVRPLCTKGIGKEKNNTCRGESL